MSRIVNVYLVRHGETDENRAMIMQGQLDTKLNAAGLEQAQLAANALENVRFAAAYSSDLSRAATVRPPLRIIALPVLPVSRIPYLSKCTCLSSMPLVIYPLPVFSFTAPRNAGGPDSGLHRVDRRSCRITEGEKMGRQVTLIALHTPNCPPCAQSFLFISNSR